MVPCSVVGPNTVSPRSKILTVFARSKAGIVCLDPTQGIDVYVCAYSLCYSVYGSGLATD
jgi:hypothetical protein